MNSETSIEQYDLMAVKSFSTDVFYIVDLFHKTCSCPHYFYRLSEIDGAVCKHVVFALKNQESQSVISTNVGE